jgi:hypothetical protein
VNLAALALKPRFIVGPVYDSLFFIGSPLLALVLGMVLSLSHLNEAEWNLFGGERNIMATLIGVFIHAHLIIVVFRSHANSQIRRLHPERFLLVPFVLLAACLLSDWVLVTCSVLATFWDVYHSGLQTFGLGRIYEMRAGNAPMRGRTLDLALNHLLYAGPILGGATMLDHFEDFTEFESVGVSLFNVVPAFMSSNQRYFAWGLLLGGGAFLIYYVLAYLRMVHDGHHVSLPKIFLLAGTGFCSIYTWGFNSFGEAFFIMNLFHALQYFALVWWREQDTMNRVFRTERLRRSKPWCFVLFVAVGLSYGTLIELVPSEWPLIYPLSIVVSLMHFWYDGFVWSVRKRQV